MSDHISDDAALYALGMLDEHEMAAIDAHVATCEACTVLLAQAHDDVAAVAIAQTQHDAPRAYASAPARRPWWGSLTAIAAAVIIALLPSGYLLERMNGMHEQMVANADMMSHLAHEHRSVAFAGTDASVMYGNDGSWYCIVVRDAKQALGVAWMHDGEKTMIGKTEKIGDVAVLYLPKSHRMDQLALMADGQVVGQARLAY